MKSLKLNVESKPAAGPLANQQNQVPDRLNGSDASERQQGFAPASPQRYRYMHVVQPDAGTAIRAATMMPLLLDRPFGCPMCGCTFTTQAALRKHVKRHSPCPNPPCSGPCCCRPIGQPAAHPSGVAKDDKPLLPHTCSQCGKSFRTAGYLAVHRRVHTGVRPFSCSCGKAFVRRCNLRAHLVSHTRERPHACLRPDCGQRFQFRKQLERHRLQCVAAVSQH
ncbi:zinc finger protein 668-like [Thrips palmi]|uniref:Zinc finger protein 668-like n=1 Tax=Thrips palmi TaxID=161013 RepID=A0A6P8ZTG5_THRPL|nr:zinc finger protein 668-like [Thrips palmi]